MKKFCLIAICAATALFQNTANAIYAHSSDKLAAAWNDVKENTGTPLILAGGRHKTAIGTFDDEYGFVGVFALDHITANGARFCSFQAQCANRDKRAKAWTTYHFPAGANPLHCYTMCKDGYAAVGNECKPVEEQVVFECNTVNNFDYLTDGIGMRRGSGDGQNIEGSVSGFYSWYDDDGTEKEVDILLGVVKFVEHGAIVSPVYLKCSREDWKNMISFFDYIYTRGKPYSLVCMPGYKSKNPSDIEAGCELIDPTFAKCDFSKMETCGGIDDTKFDDKNHKWIMGIEAVGCKVFRCKHDNYGFVAAGDSECKLCADTDGSPRFGVDDMGVCHECKTGTVFDKTQKKCVTAKAYKKTDMVYGQGKDKNSDGIKGESLKNQCWYYVTPFEYQACVACGLGKKLENNTCVDAD